MQPTFGNYLPVALFVGVVAALVVYASSALGASYPWAGAVWLVFISWALYFMAGAKTSRIHKYILGLTGGVVFGWLVIAALPYFTGVFGGTWGLPATVFVAATLIVLLELTDWFELAPAYFFAFAGYFAFLFGNFAGDASPLMAGVYAWILLMAGIGVGLLTASLRQLILSSERVPFEW